jgi:hypothetical protein
MTAPWRRAPAPDSSNPAPTPLEPAPSPDQTAADRKRKAKERNLRWRAKNPDKVREWQRNQYLKNRVQRIAAARAYENERAARDPGAAIARRVLSREKDLTAARQREKEYRERNADRARELGRERTKRYRAAQTQEARKREREANHARYVANCDEIKAKRRARYAAHKAASNALSMADDTA